ncbi:hypothetical protein DdX_12054 [Ditylenchus destructor]|uniref:Uncharacterized protein n=1 Tax=Ditylenchus destructor TaxID=166010 RepID=A0AAD4MV70_9BILA|nr:hypothetical protein DdX_12054 [Ditylenchus destructor]
MQGNLQNPPPPSYDEVNAQPLENNPESLWKNLRTWFSNKRNAGLFASATGIIMCAVLVVVHIVMLHIGEPIFYFISIIFYAFGFCGLKWKKISVVFVFLLLETIGLVIISLYFVFLVTVLIALPEPWKRLFRRPEPVSTDSTDALGLDTFGFGPLPKICWAYWWPSGNVSCNSDADLRFIIGYRAFGVLIYTAVSFALYLIICRGYKYMKTLRKTRPLPPTSIPAVYNPSIIPTADLISSIPQPAAQNQPADWPTFFDYQKNVEAERYVFRRTHNGRQDE